jgi:rhodanese-related sulfurtransferase
MRLPSRFSAAVAATLALSWALTGCSGSSSASGGSAATAVDGVKHLDVSAFAALSGAPSTIVLDVRTPAEFATGHLPNAKDLDIRSADFDAQLGTLDKQATYAVYCHSGNRSGQALDKMKAAGFTHVADLSGGVTAWSQDGKQLVTG